MTATARTGGHQWVRRVGLIVIVVVLTALPLSGLVHAETWVEAIATVVLAGFAGLQISREDRRERQRENENSRLLSASQAAAAARVGFLAYGLRRQILSWHRFPGQGLRDLPQWAEWASNGFARHFDRAEVRMDAISHLGPSLSTQGAMAVRRAGVLFFAGTGRLNEYATAIGSPSSGVILGRATLDLIELVELLEADLIPSDMIDHERQIDTLRRQQIVAGGT